MKKNKELLPVLYSQPVVNEVETQSRAELLPKIESGEVEHLDFRARVFSPMATNLNPYRFNVEDMPAFAKSFEGQPYLRDHNTYTIDARDGTLMESDYDGEWINTEVRLTTRRGMLDYIEGKMDRFSIGWFYDDAICSICNTSFFGRDCEHFPGGKYKVGNESVTCVLTFTNPKGKELSAVVVPAVQGTGITGQLAEFKLSLLQEEEDPQDEISAGQEPDVIEQTPRLAQARERLADAKNKQLQSEETMNVRDLQKQRAELIARANVLVDLTETENREFTDAERTEFESILGFGEENGEVGKLDAKIADINDKRERLRAALEATPKASEPEKPVTVTAEAKTIKRGDFDAMSAVEKAAVIKSGKKIED